MRDGPSIRSKEFEKDVKVSDEDWKVIGDIIVSKGNSIGHNPTRFFGYNHMFPKKAKEARDAHPGSAVSGVDLD